MRRAGKEGERRAEENKGGRGEQRRRDEKRRREREGVESIRNLLGGTESVPTSINQLAFLQRLGGLRRGERGRVLEEE